MNVISTKSFKHTIRDIHKNADNRKFCFVIGAGASRNSGIPTGREMADKWFSEISERLDKTELESWKTEQLINDDDLAASYGSIYRKRFEHDKKADYQKFLAKWIEIFHQLYWPKADSNIVFQAHNSHW